MGIYNNFKTWVTRTLGIEPKKPEVLDESSEMTFNLEKSDSLEAIIGEQPIKEIKEPLLQTEVQEVPIEAPAIISQKKKSLIDSKLAQSKKQVLVVNEEINKIGYISTKKYHSIEELEGDRYNVYRNLILKAIKDDKMAEMIFRSNSFKSRITCHIEIRLQSENTKQEFNVVFQAKGVDLDVITGRNPFSINGNSGFLKDHKTSLERKLETNLITVSGLQGDQSDLVIRDIQVSFDFA